MKKKEEEFEIKFWKDWLYGDTIKRHEIVEKLPIIREISSLNKLPEKMRTHTFALLLNSFFEDLESAIYTKKRLEKNKEPEKKKKSANKKG